MIMRYVDLYQQIIFTTIAVAFGFLHFVLYLFNRSSRNHLYFSIFTLMYALNIFFDFQAGLAGSANWEYFYLRIHRAVLPGTPIFLGLFVYSLFRVKIPIQFWFFAAGFIVTGAIAAVRPVEQFLWFQICLLAMFFEAFRLIAVRFKKQPDVGWVITLGFLLLIVFSLYDIFLDFGIINAFYGVQNGYPFGFLGLFVCMSIFLAREVATTNLKLKALSSQQEHTIKHLKSEIIERERAEALNKTQQEKLIQADKMASVGILVAGMAHEINNPNNYMLLNSANLGDVWKGMRPFLDKYESEHGDFEISGIPYSELKEEVQGLIDGIAEGTGRIKTIVDSLKDFARKDTGRLDELVDLNAVINSSKIILHNLIKNSSNHFSMDLADTLPSVKGNRQQIEQVIINLLSNACQALDSRSKAISINTSATDDGKQVIIQVRDEGTGIEETDLKNIMDPFYTTKRETGGTGLGLSISYKIIQDHKGEITVDSKVGEGTLFTVLLPADPSRKN